MPISKGRVQVNAHLKAEIKEKLEEIRDHHHDKGDDYMSMTRIIERLIDNEHRRLKL